MHKDASHVVLGGHTNYMCTLEFTQKVILTMVVGKLYKMRR